MFLTGISQFRQSFAITRQTDFDELIQIQSECFPPPFPSELWWNKEQLTNHVTFFPEGALCIEVDGVLAGSLTGLCVNFDPNHMEHTWEEITDNGYITNHNPNGDTLYIVDISVRPKYPETWTWKTDDAGNVSCRD